MNALQIIVFALYVGFLTAALGWIWLRPQRAIWLLLAILPLHTLTMALLFHFLHPSRTILSAYQGWKDVLLVAALVRVATTPGRWWGQRVHAVDVVVALVTAVAVLTIPLHRTLGLGSELLAFRNDFMLAPFYALGRLTHASPEARKLTLGVLAFMGLVVTAVGVVERFVDPIPLLRWIELPAFERFAYNFVFHSPFGLPYSYFQANSARRVGSVLLSSVGLATMGSVTLAAGAGLLRTAGTLRGRQGILALAALHAGVLAIVLAAGRLALLIAPVLLGLALFFTRRWQPILAAMGLLVLLFGLFNFTFYANPYPNLPANGPPTSIPALSPAEGHTSSSSPSSASKSAGIQPLLTPNDQSLAAHLHSIELTGTVVSAHPLGQGLGAAGLSAARNQRQPGEGQLYTTAVDFGVPGLLSLAILLIACLMTAWRSAQAGREPGFALTTLLVLVYISATVPVAEIFTDLYAMAAGFWCLGQLVRSVQVKAPATGPVLVDLTCLRTAQAGVRRYAEGLRQSLSALAPQVTMRETAGPVPRYRVPESLLRKLARHVLLLAWYQAGLPLAALVHGARLLVCPEYYCPWVAPCPRLVVFHDTLFWDRPEYPRWWRALLWLNATGPAARAELVVTPSASQVPRLARLLHCSETGIAVVPPLVRPMPTPNAIDADLRELRLAPGYLLHLGALERRKDIPSLVEAYAAARDRADHWPQLVVAGPRSPIAALDDSSMIDEAIRRTQLIDQVRVVGAIPERLLPALLRGAAALVFAGTAEGFGIPLVEAMAAGIPVVAFESQTTTEVVGEAGLLVPTGDGVAMAEALRRLVTESSLRGELAERGKQRARQYDLDATVSRWRALTSVPS